MGEIVSLLSKLRNAKDYNPPLGRCLVVSIIHDSPAPVYVVVVVDAVVVVVVAVVVVAVLLLLRLRFLQLLLLLNDRKGGGQGGQNLPPPVPCSPASRTFISRLPPFSVLLPPPVNWQSQNTS